MSSEAFVKDDLWWGCQNQEIVLHFCTDKTHRVGLRNFDTRSRRQARPICLCRAVIPAEGTKKEGGYKARVHFSGLARQSRREEHEGESHSDV